MSAAGAGDAARELIDAVRFGHDGLVAAVVQDARDGRVLTQAWMSRESLELTLQRGETWFWSRSRQELWRKGATSGNTQAVRSVSLDCDGDALLVRVDQTGVACHTGEATCFHRPMTAPAGEPFAALADLESTVAARAAAADPESSYTARLLAKGIDTVCKKVGEEATEVVIAAKGRERDQVVYESADLLYHLAVLWSAAGVGFGEVAAELESRRAAQVTRLRLEAPARRGPQLEVTPGIERVRAMVGEHGQVPLVHTYIADCETPVSAFLKLRDGGPAFLLESVEQGRLGRYSMIGVRPQAVIRGAGGELTVTEEGGTSRPLDAADPFGAVEDVVRGVGMAPPVDPLTFWGGAVGYFGYDLVRTVERLPGQPDDDVGVPDLIALVTGPVVVFDHLRRSLTIVVPCPLDRDGDVGAAYRRAVVTLSDLKGRLAGPVPHPADRADEPTLGPVVSNMERERFEGAVERAREYIFAGDAFQVVPSQRFSAPMTLDPFAVYRGLRTVNPSPYMYFLETDEVTLVGSSPEMLVKVEGGMVEMHPIAGSRPRGATEEEDDRLATELLADPKERAEHVMLVNLGRNDLGRVSEIGTVRVTDLMDVRRYSHVMHIESSVVGRLAAGMRASDALRATFPAGTLSGAPKVRAMEIIDELEPTKRGPYGGAVGWLGWGGGLDTCITIRTIVCRDGVAHVQAGAGIVADSVPATEYEETQNKAAALFRAIEVAAAQSDW